MKWKIIAGIAAAALVGVWFVSPQFRQLTRYGFDSVMGLRNRARQSAMQNQAGPSGDVLALADQCRARMRSIEGAKIALLNERGYEGAGGTPTHEAIAARLGENISFMACPATGNRYLLGHTAQRVQCTVGANGTPTYQDDDHSI